MNKEPFAIDDYPELFATVSQLADKLRVLHQRAVQQYTPIVQSIVRSHSRDVRHIEATLDWLLGHCCYEPALVLYKQLCRYYFTPGPAVTVSYRLQENEFVVPPSGGMTLSQKIPAEAGTTNIIIFLNAVHQRLPRNVGF